MKTVVLFIGAALAEIAGCYGFWMWLRLDRSFAWGVIGTGSLMVFAWLLTRIDMNFAGRAYASYGGIYIAAVLLWLSWVEGARPDRWDLIGVAICLVGSSVIIFAPRSG